MQANIKVMGSAGRADAAAVPTGGARSQASVVTESPPHRWHISWRSTSSFGKALSHRSHLALRRAVRAMPGPLALPMSAAAFGLVPPTARSKQHNCHRCDYGTTKRELKQPRELKHAHYAVRWLGLAVVHPDAVE